MAHATSPAVQAAWQQTAAHTHIVTGISLSKQLTPKHHWTSNDQWQPAAANALGASCSTKHTQWLQHQLGPVQQHRQRPGPGAHWTWLLCQQLQPQGRRQTTARAAAVAAAAAAAAGPAGLRPLKPPRQGIAVVEAVYGRSASFTRQARHVQKARQQQSSPWQVAVPCPGAVEQRLPVVASSSNSSSSSSSSYPRLLPSYPDTVDSCQQQLCEVLHITPKEAQLIMLSSADAAALPRQQLAANWAQLQGLLPVSKPQLLQAMLQLPELLLQPQQVLSVRLAEAAAVLQLPLAQLQRRRGVSTPQLHWQLLLLSKHELEERIADLLQLLDLEQQLQQRRQQQQQWQQQLQQQWQEQLQQLLDKLRQQLVWMVVQEPRLLSVGQAQLVSSVEALEQACSWPLARLLPGLCAAPRLLVMPAQQLYAAAAALQQQLRLSEEGLALALRRAPAALLVPAGQLSDVLAELAASLGVPADVATDILLQEPQLLLRRPGAVSAVLGVLRSTFRLSNDELLQVVQYDPTVLGWSPGALADSSSKFREAAGRHKAWAAEYKRLMSKPVNVARALRIEPLRLLRLTYLTRMRRGASSSLTAAVSASGRQFVSAYPGYAPWLAQQYSAGGVPRQYRGNALYEDEDEDEY